MPSEAKPCRGGCGKLIRKNCGRCNACDRVAPKRRRKAKVPVCLRASDWCDDNVTEAELERTIAEQLSKPLPSWWDNSEHRTGIRESDARPGIRVFHVRAGSVAKRQPYLW